jgi:hypothetical protein
MRDVAHRRQIASDEQQDDKRLEVVILPRPPCADLTARLLASDRDADSVDSLHVRTSDITA